MLLCFSFVHAMNVQAIMSSDLDEVYPQQVIALNHLYWYDVGALFSLNPKYAHEMEMNWGATPGRQGLLYRIMFEPHRWVNDEVDSFLTLHSGELIFSCSFIRYMYMLRVCYIGSLTALFCLRSCHAIIFSLQQAHATAGLLGPTYACTTSKYQRRRRRCERTGVAHCELPNHLR